MLVPVDLEQFQGQEDWETDEAIPRRLPRHALLYSPAPKN